jgi:hypothetical protein
MGIAKRLVLAATLAAALGTALVGGAAANNGTTLHGSGKDRPGYCDPTFCPEDAAPAKSHGTFLYGEPGSTRRAQPEPGGEAGCTTLSAINSNPPQAAGDNAAYPSETALERTAQPEGGSKSEGWYYQCTH